MGIQLDLQHFPQLSSARSDSSLGIEACSDDREGGNLSVSSQSKERPKKEAKHSRLIGGSFNEQRNFFTKTILGAHRKSRFLHLATRSKSL